MKIEHSELYSEFLTFWFETEVDGKLIYETLLNYTDMRWVTRLIENPELSIATGNIETTSNEKAEEQRIRDLVTQHITMRSKRSLRSLGRRSAAP